MRVSNLLETSSARVRWYGIESWGEWMPLGSFRLGTGLQATEARTQLRVCHNICLTCFDKLDAPLQGLLQWQSSQPSLMAAQALVAPEPG